MIAWGSSHVGQVRETNEDAFVIECWQRGGFLVVADGMGGHQAGEVASNLVTVFLRRHLQQWRRSSRSVAEDFLRQGVLEANDLVFKKANREATLTGMGTTVTAALISEGRLVWAHVGDSRLYLYRRRHLRLLTRDHSLVQGLVEEGVVTQQEAERHPRRHVLVRAIGTDDQVEVDTGSLYLYSGDQLLVCTDGLSNALSRVEMEKLLAGQHTLAHQGQALLNKALARGGVDNITVVLGQVRPLGSTALEE